MPPKVKVTKEDILHAAVETVRHSVHARFERESMALAHYFANAIGEGITMFWSAYEAERSFREELISALKEAECECEEECECDAEIEVEVCEFEEVVEASEPACCEAEPCAEEAPAEEAPVEEAAVEEAPAEEVKE